MTRFVKGGKKTKFITGDDVLITKGIKHPGKTVDETVEEIDDTLDKHSIEIEKLKSNLKYVYSYGGVGGKASGGSGGGSSEPTPVLYVSIDGHPIQSGPNNIITLNKPATYLIEGTVSKPGGKTYVVKVDTAEKVNSSTAIVLSPETENRYSFTKSITLSKNSDIVIQFMDSSRDRITDDIRQTVIVTPHTFDVKFKYQFYDDSDTLKPGVFSEPYEYFMGDSTHLNPFIEASYQINRQGVTNVSISYNIGNTDENEEEEYSGQGVVDYRDTTDITRNPFIRKLNNLKKNGNNLIDPDNTGTISVNVTLKYFANGDPVTDVKTFEITLIPNYLYIIVRNSHNVIYDTYDELVADMVSDIPRKNIYVSNWTYFYCKVYEKEMRSKPESYPLTMEVYDEYDGSDDDHDLFDDVPSVTINKPEMAEEQVETPIPFQVAFQSPGIKKLVFSTIGQKTTDHSNEKPVVKYIYAKPLETDIDWYPNIEQKTFYFRANSGFSDSFPREPFNGTSPLELSVTSQPVTLTNRNWAAPAADQHTTILSVGVQYSSVNKENSEILSTYAMNDDGTFSDRADVTLNSESIFGRKIRIPSESNFNKSINSQYHLIQIVRHRIDYDESIQRSTYATYLYIDGKPESNKNALDYNLKLHIGKIVLNNVNIIYNLINLQYVKLELPETSKGNYLEPKSTNTIDALIYQYWLAYKERMGAGVVTTAEKELFHNLSDIKFDGENVVVNKNFVNSISKFMPIPTMMMEYQGSDVDDFAAKLFRGYKDAASNEFPETFVKLHWSTGAVEGSVNPELISFGDPEITDKNNNYYHGDWYVKLQGTSTMRNKIKNFSLGVKTRDVISKEIVFSPNYDKNNKDTFLPEQEWTIKADVADSAHANNTAIGKFVNDVCTPFIQNNGQGFRDDIKPFIKNTLQGFPILMYFKIGKEDTAKVYYLGIYNFNMGRQSHYNLGYNTANDTKDMVDNIIQFSNTPFSISVGTNTLASDLVVGEIQENNPEFDFHQYNESVLFSSASNSGAASMFGNPETDKVLGSSVKVISTLSNFVKSVAQAGAYCFSNIGKLPRPSKDADGACIDVYNVEPYEDPTTGKTKYYEYVPDLGWQFRYDGTTKIWSHITDNTSLTFDGIKNDTEMLLKCIYETQEDGTPHAQGYNNLEYTSVSEYYTVCMAFGLVDSILKNMNIKSWDGHKCFIAFYDMDCAFGVNNAGEELITYLAATDYWHSEVKDGYLQEVSINYDYWDTSNGWGFDFKSSYLFAIAKYAYPILKKKGITLKNYPQEFWARLRKPGSPLENADTFMRNYFTSGIGEVPSYLTAMNYQVKYLYKGEYFDENNNVQSSCLANSSAFNGTRVEKVRDWLNKRFHFLDVVFNVQGVNYAIGDGTYTLPIATEDTYRELPGNPDITILTDMFSKDTARNAILNSVNIPIGIVAPKNTPCIISIGQSTNEIYILNAEPPAQNILNINVRAAQAFRILGSKEFINLSSVEPLLTNAEWVNSNKIEEIKYGGRTDLAERQVNFDIYSTSVKNIQFNIPAFSGTLNIPYDNLNGQALHTLNVSGSGLYGTWENLKDLQNLDISSVNSGEGTISVSGCPLLTGEHCIISGIDGKPTTLKVLRISNVSGKFNITNTRIEEMYFSISQDEGYEGEIVIDGDKSLNKLTLSGFKSIEIRNCPNLKTLKIDNEDKCEKLIIDIPEDNERLYTLDGFNNEYNTAVHTKYVRETDPGVFDFTKFVNLNTLGLCGSEAVVIKIPNHTVTIESFRNNKKLEFVDTSGPDSCIKLTQDSTFYNCPNYGMRQSWWSTDDGIDTDITDYRISAAKYGNYTRMCISDECTTLAHTFDKLNSDNKTSYLNETGNYYENIWGQKVYNRLIDRMDACQFINEYVSGARIDDEYIDNDGIIHDTQGQGHRSFGNDCRAKIISLQGCFNKQSGIIYDGQSSWTMPDLSGYTSLTDISQMYYGTGVKRITKVLLSLPFELNNNESSLVSWYDFIGNGEMKVSKDAFINISYRISTLNTMNLSIYDTSNTYKLVNTDDPYFNIVNLLGPHKKDGSNITYNNGKVSEITFNPEDSLDTYELFTRIKSITSFGVNPSQWIDYRNLLNMCPEITSLTGFLSSDLSKSKIDGMLKNCKNLTDIENSFIHSGDVEQLDSIDLYEFFNWGSPEDNLYDKMIKLFTTTSSTTIGFAVKKHISIENFKSIIKSLHNYKRINALSNIFSYCTINGYDGFPIVLEDDMTEVKNINALFYKCKGIDNLGNDVPLHIRRSFFEHLPNVTSMAYTFYGVYFDRMFTYDFFCKRINPEDSQPSRVYVEIDGSIAATTAYEAELYETVYKPNALIDNMSYCFCNAKFVNCKSWFDPNDEENDGLEPHMNFVKKGNDTSYTKYYIRQGGNFVEYNISTPTALSDTIHNFTNYEEYIQSVSRPEMKINNHDIIGDAGHYGNMTEGQPFVVTAFNLYPTYCCLPPDILYGCHTECNLTNVFANTNIIGVLPQHLLMKCFGSRLSDMFMNVNILPNLMYHYDKNTVNNSDYLALINGTYEINGVTLPGIPIDETTISTKDADDEIVCVLDNNAEATVLFRNSNGELRRRRPVISIHTDGDSTPIEDNTRLSYIDFNKSQFTYVPQGYSTNQNLERAFTFRYNLPGQVDLNSQLLADAGIVWPASQTNTYGDAYTPDMRPDLWPYYTQYFFTVDESLSWRTIYNMKHPFISDDQDIDFSTNAPRVFYTTDDNADKNKWWNDRIDAGTMTSTWYNQTEGVLNCFLDLCGKRNKRTGKLNDNGCLISEPMAANKYPKLDAFVSGILVVFLNGKVFDDIDAARFSIPLYADTDNIIIYNIGLGRNIIFPMLNAIPADYTKASKVLLSHNPDVSMFYRFMFPVSSLTNYENVFRIKDPQNIHPNQTERYKIIQTT